MTSQATSETLAKGVAAHQAGRLAEAERLYLAVLAAEPRHAGALHLLGLVAYQTGRSDRAVDLIAQAIARAGGIADFHSNLGLVRRSRGEREAAIACYRHALALDPGHVAALANLGDVLLEQGEVAEAIALCRRALARQPDYPEALCNLGNALQRAGDLEEAGRCYERAIAVRPAFAQALSNLGALLQAQGRHEEARARYRAALAIEPGHQDALSNLGTILQKQERLDEAIACYETAIGAGPASAETLSNLGTALRLKGRHAEAIARYEQALVLAPRQVDILTNLANALRESGRLDEAVARCEEALAIKPDHAEALANLGTARQRQGRLEEAVSAYERALAIKPDYLELLANYGAALQEQGRVAEAVQSHERAIAIDPDFAIAHSNLQMAMHYGGQFSSADILAKARRFAASFEGRHAAAPHANPPQPERRLRIGYVSGDFGRHPVGYFLERVLQSHDAAAIETFCYSNRSEDDPLTLSLRQSAHHWRNIVGVADDAADAMVRQDGIDILVDLAGHTAKNRLLLLARRPAPVQATWLGYFGTTGLSAIDYILCDRVVLPEGEEALFSETPWRLPGCYLCYSPHRLDIPVGPVPALAKGCVTFGSFNNRSKLMPEVLAAWAELLHRVPGSRLFLKTRQLGDEAVRRELTRFFAARDIDAQRLRLEGQSPLDEALAAYNDVDIALDPFPFGGGTTTAEALWMGVPLLCFRGDRWTGRMSETILAAIGLRELVAADLRGYLDLAAALAGDPARLTALRAGLRARLTGSAFCDGPTFTRGLEAAYRAMWRRWCAQQAGR